MRPWRRVGSISRCSVCKGATRLLMCPVTAQEERGGGDDDAAETSNSGRGASVGRPAEDSLGGRT